MKQERKIASGERQEERANDDDEDGDGLTSNPLRCLLNNINAAISKVLESVRRLRMILADGCRI
jgi:hypothetical protein